jgi:hypothetical protein
MTHITTTLAMSSKAIMDMISALHTAEDTIVIFSTPVYDAVIPVVLRPINAAEFMITS